MRNAYALLGLAFLIVFVGAYIIIERANAPTPEDIPVVVTETQGEAQNDIIPNAMALTLTSPAFGEGGKIPSKYTCDGENVSPELRISGVPSGTQSLVLVMDDPDIPESVKASRGIQKFDHWALYNIPADTGVIEEGKSVGTPALTSTGKPGYVGSCPPDREHRYFFRLYALSGTLNFIQAPTLDEVEEVAKGMALASTTLMGRYERVKD